MSDNIVLNGLTVSPSVIETIVGLAVETVPGADIYGASALRKSGLSRAIEVNTDAEGSLILGIHLIAQYGNKLSELGEIVRQAVIDALTVQVGLESASIDIYFDAISFPE